MTPDSQRKAALARSKKLAPSRRAEIAATAAAARWDKSITAAVCGSADSPLRIGDIEIECYVLADGTRVLTQASFLTALGRHRRAAGSTSDLPPMLQGNALKPYITAEIIEEAKPITFRLPSGVRASGYRAELLPKVCEIWLKAADAGDLPRNQEHIAVQASILVRGLAHVGIIALVDEATGYQEVRARDALAQILEAFIDDELQPYIKTFPADYYKEMFRLRGLEFPTATVQRPRYFGTLTNDIVYKRLAPGVLEELKSVVRRDDQGRPKDKLFQHLTQNVGYPKLREHLGSVVTLMKLSRDWTDFKVKLDVIHPRVNETYGLPLVLESEDDGIGL